MWTSEMCLLNTKAHTRLAYLISALTRLNQLRAVCESRLAIDGGTQLQSVDDIHL